jgi:hypothetical protein
VQLIIYVKQPYTNFNQHPFHPLQGSSKLPIQQAKKRKKGETNKNVPTISNSIIKRCGRSLINFTPRPL